MELWKIVAHTYIWRYKIRKYYRQFAIYIRNQFVAHNRRRKEIVASGKVVCCTVIAVASLVVEVAAVVTSGPQLATSRQPGQFGRTWARVSLLQARVIA